MKTKIEKEIEFQNLKEFARDLAGAAKDVYEICRSITESKLFNYIFLLVVYYKTVPLITKILLRHHDYKYVIYAFVIYVMSTRGKLPELVINTIVIFFLMTSLFLFLEHGETLLNYL